MVYGDGKHHHCNCFCIVPETIFAETMVLTKVRLNHDVALSLGQHLQGRYHFLIEPLTLQIFICYTDKDLSYVDFHD